MFGLYPKFKPKMAKVYGNAGEVILNGLKNYHDEVIGKVFPSQVNYFGMPDEEYAALEEVLGLRPPAPQEPVEVSVETTMAAEDDEEHEKKKKDKKNKKH